jgi:hypothetical protein
VILDRAFIYHAQKPSSLLTVTWNREVFNHAMKARTALKNVELVATAIAYKLALNQKNTKRISREKGRSVCRFSSQCYSTSQNCCEQQVIKVLRNLRTFCAACIR